LGGNEKHREIHCFSAQYLPRKDNLSDTRIFVDYVLILVTQSHSWNYIEEQWNGAVIKDAIKEALILSKNSLMQQTEKLTYV
jgi:hypothetical protein